MQAPENAYAVILAGGGGTRLWPKSRKEHPKHLLKLFGKDTLLQTTYNRIAPIIPDERILVITATALAGEVKKQLPGIPQDNVILEPKAKNTALAMGIAAAFVKKRNPDGVIINLAADHLFKDVERFQGIALAALDVATSFDYVVSIGIKPTFPHTGLGYIKVGDQIGQVRVSTYSTPRVETVDDLDDHLFCWKASRIICQFTNSVKSVYSMTYGRCRYGYYFGWR